ncbi:MAG: carboxypeptidase-like regulatory domain-containing protein [Acidobacteria bacterium]|nr:carboxypeptidase-like regulatory domain-containing protein [Acidobacteriota bacterium]
MKVFAIGFLLAMGLGGQASKDLLLSEARTINGLVVDQDNAPVKDALIFHAALDGVPSTNSQGRFRIATRAPAIVIRKAGYASAFLRTGDIAADDEMQLVLKPITRTLRACSGTEAFVTLEGLDASFRFAPMPQIQASEQGRDVDYGIRSYLSKTPKGDRRIAHGSGPTWGGGWPLNPDVWASRKLEEVCFEIDGRTIYDARGERADGTRWRTLGVFGETATYRNVDKDASIILDKFIDGVCVVPFKRPGE